MNTAPSAGDPFWLAKEYLKPRQAVGLSGEASSVSVCTGSLTMYTMLVDVRIDEVTVIA